jgi:hypothetical protein
MLRFEDGAGTLVPALRGYVGHVLVERGTVANINFLPSTSSPQWDYYAVEYRKLERLRATVAATARLGVFRVDRDNAKEFADQIRVMKGVDPTLGLYAAYAYSAVGLTDQIRSVRDYMLGDLGVEFFDVAMLTRRNVTASEGGPNVVVPACPMLRQGWDLVDVVQAKLADVMRDARQWLRPGLWTTFKPEATSMLIRAVEGGQLQ